MSLSVVILWFLIDWALIIQIHFIDLVLIHLFFLHLQIIWYTNDTKITLYFIQFQKHKSYWSDLLLTYPTKLLKVIFHIIKGTWRGQSSDKYLFGTCYHLKIEWKLLYSSWGYLMNQISYFTYNDRLYVRTISKFFVCKRIFYVIYAKKLIKKHFSLDESFYLLCCSFFHTHAIYQKVRG